MSGRRNGSVKIKTTESENSLQYETYQSDH